MRRSFFSVPVCVALVAALLSGCHTLLDPNLTEPEREALAFNVQGLKIGSRPSALAAFAQVQKIPVRLDGMDVYEIFNPSPQIGMMLASFQNDALKRLEIRYFDGPTSSTLTRSGGWAGIRDYLIAKFGPPSKQGEDVPVTARQPGLDPKNALFNGEWIFSRINRGIHYIALADRRTGVAVVTVSDTTPAPAPAAPAAPASAAPAASATPNAASAPPATPRAPDPGF